MHWRGGVVIEREGMREQKERGRKRKSSRFTDRSYEVGGRGGEIRKVMASNFASTFNPDLGPGGDLSPEPVLTFQILFRIEANETTVKIPKLIDREGNTFERMDIAILDFFGTLVAIECGGSLRELGPESTKRQLRHSTATTLQSSFARYLALQPILKSDARPEKHQSAMLMSRDGHLGSLFRSSESAVTQDTVPPPRQGGILTDAARELPILCSTKSWEAIEVKGLFKGSTTTLDGIGVRPTPAERPRTLRKLKSVYDTPPAESPGPPPVPPAPTNGVEDIEPRRRSNTNSSTQSADKSLAILSPFDEQRINKTDIGINPIYVCASEATGEKPNVLQRETSRKSDTREIERGDAKYKSRSSLIKSEEWAKISEIMASIGTKMVRESVFVAELEQEFTSRLGLSCSDCSLSPSITSNLGIWLSSLGLIDYEPIFMESGFDDIDFINGILDENDLREMGIDEAHRPKILESSKQLPLKIAEISTNHNNNNISKVHNQNESVEDWLKNINLEQYSETFRKHLYVDMDRVRRVWEVELTAVLEIQKPGHRKRILASVSGQQNGPISNIGDINTDLNSLKNNIQQLKDDIKEKLPENLKPVPPPTVPTLAPPGGETLKRSKKNRPAPQPPRPSDLEIRAPSELLVGVPGALKTQWKHQPFVLVTGAVTYVANYLGSTVVKELRGTESTKKSIQKLKKSTKEPRDSPDIILSISYRGVKFLNTITRGSPLPFVMQELICEHEIRNIHCACQDADDLTHFAYITKDHATRSHYCHVFCVATMDQATEVILTLGEAFEVAYQMALREQANRSRVQQTQAKTPTHDPMTTTTKEKPNVNHGRSHSITEIKLNGHQLKVAPIPASLSNEDFQVSSRSSEGSRSPRTPLLKAPIASTEEL
ncbi:Ankyrin repeat and SAM domain-containing protein 1A [Eumeta japonica]|uniref:Ankyrin repeat and SAM domain-containing protein 1A n=1 Tax=Eumeta variegata TaxID=151549 RepID=A0A4C1ZHD3_EUMVA|nr:Ankyrin repeat and SAM domain-containing protein 1A [Eumeta japonica]